jgi:hypothetical protein
MVELTIPLVLDIIRTVGILVGIVYYLTIMRNNQRNQKTAEETRKIQLLLDHNRDIIGRNNWNSVMDMEWDDYNDFMSKYGWDSDPDLYEKRMGIWRRMHFSGLLIRDGLIDVSTFIDYIGDNSPLMWNKFKDIIEEQRVLFDSPNFLIGIEYGAKAVEQYRLNRGMTPKVPMDD